MDNAQLEEKARELSEANERMAAALKEIREVIDPFMGEKKPTKDRSFEAQLVHDVRNIINELGLLRALVPSDEQDK